jgi:hypothetical protein
MRVQSFASTNIFWRACDWNDAVCLVGAQEGIVSPNQHVDWDHPGGKMKLELKVNDIHGRLIMGAGTVLTNKDGSRCTTIISPCRRT